MAIKKVKRVETKAKAKGTLKRMQEYRMAKGTLTINAETVERALETARKLEGRTASQETRLKHLALGLAAMESRMERDLAVRVTELEAQTAAIRETAKAIQETLAMAQHVMGLAIKE